jgi:maltose alpha-D-glucosyltransferase/alpha-amylase
MLGERSQLELAYSILFALPGTPVLRYGDEIGMGEDLGLKERDAVRTPMQWSHEPHGGFSTAERCVKPVVDAGPYGYPHVNVETQRRDPNSLLNWTVRMVRLRKECPEVGWGAWRVLPTRSSSVLALCYEWRGNAVVTLHNFSGGAQAVRLPLAGVEGGDRLSNLLVNEERRARADGVHEIPLEAFGYKWYRVGGMGYALHSRRDSGAGVAW